ncbi:hypothetical protein DRN46_03800 [Thermococci archaeon]|nr:MAG: hypothetical protein DRN46_03800 [Thermococci archaeon]
MNSYEQSKVDKNACEKQTIDSEKQLTIAPNLRSRLSSKEFVHEVDDSFMLLGDSLLLVIFLRSLNQFIEHIWIVDPSE